MIALAATPHRLAVIASSDINRKNIIFHRIKSDVIKEKRNMRKILIIGMVAVAATACNVTRTMTTESRYIQRNDTSIVIQTKTVETYDASKKL